MNAMKLSKIKTKKAVTMKRSGLPLKAIASELHCNVVDACRATKSIQPKQKQCKIKRHPAIYSNKSREQYITEILGLDI